MAKLLDPLAKCMIANKILAEINNAQLASGEKVQITFTTKNNGDLKELSIERKEKGDK